MAKRTWGGWAGAPGTEAGETVLGSWPASIPFKRWDGALEGGNLILTEQHLLFRALRVPMVLGDVVVLGGGRAPRWIVALADIRAVEPVSARRSQLRVETADGNGRHFNIAAGRFASRRNKENAVARDEAIALIRAVAANSSAR